MVGRLVVLIALPVLAAGILWPRDPVAAKVVHARAEDGRVPSGYVALGSSKSDSGWSTRIRDPRTGLAFRLVEAGSFQMGCTFPTDDPKATVRVTIPKPFYLGETEVPVKAWRVFATATNYKSKAERHSNYECNWAKPVGADMAAPLDISGPKFVPFQSLAAWDESHPVTWVNYHDAVAFCEHFGYRLPREAEWEYACRAGTTTLCWWDDDPAGAAGKCNCRDRSFMTLYRNPEEESPVRRDFDFTDGFVFTAPVGTFKPNPWGFHDMIGNVAEWCEETLVQAIARGPSDNGHRIDVDNGYGADRVYRGGHWMTWSTLNDANCYWRCTGDPENLARGWLGFRAALDP